MGIKYDGITARMFTGPNGFFSIIQLYLFLYIPLLTMGVFSREKSSGSIKLLYSSPINTFEIILGKYLSLLIYCFLLALLLLFIALISNFGITHADLPLIFSGISGTYLLIITYAAIGLFMSSLTSYQLVAAIGTFIMLAALNYIGQLGQSVGFIRHLTSFLSVRGRLSSFTNGLINSNDVAYFLIITLLFLSLSWLSIQSVKESVSILTKVLRYILVLFVAFVLGWFTSLPQFTAYRDVTYGKTQTLTPQSQAILKQFTSPLHITTYVNLLDRSMVTYGLPENREADERWFDPYARFLPGRKIDFKYICYYDSLEKDDFIYQQYQGMTLKEMAENEAYSNDIDFNKVLGPAEIRKMVNLKPFKNKFIRELKANGKTAYIGMYNSSLDGPYPKEFNMIGALKNLVIPSPQIVFLTGHHERSVFGNMDRDFTDRLNNLMDHHATVNQGASFSELLLDTVSRIPLNIAALVIADPTLPFSSRDLIKIRQYLDNGGNAWILGEPGRQGIINPIIDSLGVTLTDGMLVSDIPDRSPDVVQGNFAPDVNKLSPQLEAIQKDSGAIQANTVVALQISKASPFLISPLFSTGAYKTWLYKGNINTDSTGVKFDSTKTTYSQSYNMAVALQRNTGSKEQRILIFGDADHMANDGWALQYRHKKVWEIAEAIVSFFSYGQYPVDVSRAKQPDNNIEYTEGKISAIHWMLILVLPAFLLIAGSVILIRRTKA